jgi:hypothetical protein
MNYKITHLEASTYLIKKSFLKKFNKKKFPIFINLIFTKINDFLFFYSMDLSRVYPQKFCPYSLDLSRVYPQGFVPMFVCIKHLIGWHKP